MSRPEQETEASIEIPEPLRPAKEYDDWRVCLRPEALGLAGAFSKQFRVTAEEGVMSLLTTVSHSLGESEQVALPHGNFSPPLNWLAITAEQEPIWTGSLLRYLRTGIEELVETKLRIHNANSERDVETDRRAEEAIDPEKRLERLTEAAGLQALRRIVDTITTDNPKPPFDRSPIDRVVSLLTPPGGLLRSLSRISPLEILGLEEALMGVRASSLRNRPVGPAPTPFFLWQVPEVDARAFFRQHGKWFRQIPAIVTRGSQSSFPCIDIDAPVLRQYERLAQLLFTERHARHGNPRIHQIDANSGKSVMRFLNEAGKHQVASKDDLPLRWVADLGIKLSLSLMRLEEEQALNPRLVENGLELAKFFALQRMEILSATGWGHGAENAETADLSTEERRAYLKICESDGMTKADLRRSSHGMSAGERDRIVAKLLSLRLIRQDGKLLRQNAA
ncbi:MAG: hypothetical protein KDN18_01760 [Verrucomicrobiae bacterium]|nr:hypothetical protein [Verrucomicrobiae bacterium]